MFSNVLQNQRCAAWLCCAVRLTEPEPVKSPVCYWDVLEAAEHWNVKVQVPQSSTSVQYSGRSTSWPENPNQTAAMCKHRRVQSGPVGFSHEPDLQDWLRVFWWAVRTSPSGLGPAPWARRRLIVVIGPWVGHEVVWINFHQHHMPPQARTQPRENGGSELRGWNVLLRDFTHWKVYFCFGGEINVL